jgi:DNA-directed RNA polymerase subunit RPC12/RpoP
MIKIIDTKPHKSVVREVVCKHCGSTLEYTPSDIEQSYSTDYTGGRDYYNLIKCPSCSHEIGVE